MKAIIPAAGYATRLYTHTSLNISQNIDQFTRLHLKRDDEILGILSSFKKLKTNSENIYNNFLNDVC